MREIFETNGKLNRMVLLLFGVISAIVLVNAILHEPTIQFDGSEHFGYFTTLAEGRLPGPRDTRGFFWPPLPYAFPALLKFLGLDEWWCAKFAQTLNVVLSMGVLVFLLGACQLIRPESQVLKLGTLGFLCILPVYYRSFSFVRGEPYVAFFTAMSILFFIRGDSSTKTVVLLGLSVGGATLSRQWAFLLLPGLAVFAIFWLVHKKRLVRSVPRLLVAAVLAFACSGWFYLHLNADEGRVTAFNKKPKASFDLGNQPRHFYTGSGDGQLFRHPVRRFANQFFPQFYADTWGDWWGFFVVYGYNMDKGTYVNGHYVNKMTKEDRRSPTPEWLRTNRFSIAPYLGRVNLLALLPTLVALLAVGYAVFTSFRAWRRGGTAEAAICLILLMIVTTLVGYFWFLIMYPNPRHGGGIKATYMLQVFVLLAPLLGNFAHKVNAYSQRGFLIMASIFGMVFLYEVPIFFSRYVNPL
jgi:hypothetical protein